MPNACSNISDSSLSVSVIVLSTIYTVTWKLQHLINNHGCKYASVCGTGNSNLSADWQLLGHWSRDEVVMAETHLPFLLLKTKAQPEIANLWGWQQCDQLCLCQTRSFSIFHKVITLTSVPCFKCHLYILCKDWLMLEPKLLSNAGIHSPVFSGAWPHSLRYLMTMPFSVSL